MPRARFPAPVSLWLGLLLGYALALRAPLPAGLEDPLRLAALVLAAASLGAALVARRFHARVAPLLRLRRTEAACGLLALLAAGGTLGAETDRIADPLPVHPPPVWLEIEGRVVESVSADAADPTVIVDARRARAGSAEGPCRSALLLRWGHEGPAPAWAEPGLWIRARGEYRPPEDARNAGISSPGRWLERAGLAGTIRIDPSTVAILAEPPEAGIVWGGLIRRRIARLYSRDLSPPVAALARGMALGDRSGIAPKIRDSFRDGGTIHILSISGLHVCVLAGIVAAIAVAFRLPAAPAVFVELVSLWGYVLLVGAPASAVRSAILWSALRAGRVRGTAVRPFAAWGLAGLLIQLGDPAAVLDLGFQLSFAAVLGLAASAGLRLELGDGTAGRAIPRALRRAGAVLLALARQSAFAEAGTLGLQVFHFGAVPIAGVLLNLAVIPLCGVFMAALVLHLGCGFVLPPLEHAAAGAVDVPGLLMLWLTRLVSDRLQPVPARVLPAFGTIGASLLALLLAAAAWERARAEGRTDRTVALAALLALGLAWTLPFIPLPRPVSRSTWILALDVGQGDATIARLPGSTLLVDAGPSSDTRDEGRYTVEPALRAEGITRVDLAILSHAHRDHYGGLGWLAGRGFLAQVLENGDDPLGAWREPIARGLVKYGGAIACVRSDTILLAPGGDLRLLGADRTLPEEGPANARENNRSLVAFLHAGGGVVCFAGDVEREAEDAIRWRMEPTGVLKVPHHGSKTSSEGAWIGALAPRVAIVSCGEGNRFGHPDAATVGRYLLRGTRVFRTDREGSVRVTFVRGGALVSTRAHPEPELLRWARAAPLTPSGQSP